MRVFEAAGSGLENFQLLHNAIGIAKFTVLSGSVTSNSANRGLGLANATSASGLYSMSWAASAFGTASAPNILIHGGVGAATNFGMGAVSVVATDSAVVWLGIQKNQVTASAAISNDLITASVPFTIIIIPYSASGTQFTFATA